MIFDRIEFVCFSFRVDLLSYQLFVFQTGHLKLREFWRCIKQKRTNFDKVQFLKEIPKLRSPRTDIEKKFSYYLRIGESYGFQIWPDSEGPSSVVFTV